MSSFARLAFLLPGLMLLAGVGATAHAQTIAPVLVELTPARRVASVTMTNTSSRAMTYQAQTVAWTQSEGADVYADSADLLVVPPVADLAPGARQIFRIALRGRPPSQETAYRLILEDVTEDIAAPTEGATLRLQIRHSLPVFVGPASTDRGRARVAACPELAAINCVRIHNDGDRRFRLTQLDGEAAGWRQQIKTSATVLAGAWMQWSFAPPPALAGQSFKVTVATTASDVSTELPVPAH
jgi:fimbrial chaperone protein